MWLVRNRTPVNGSSIKYCLLPNLVAICGQAIATNSATVYFISSANFGTLTALRTSSITGSLMKARMFFTNAMYLAASTQAIFTLVRNQTITATEITVTDTLHYAVLTTVWLS